jgi:UDP-N-acetylglucosamine--N-acetylmuramyl-(pentapeptide) pyrophosphoryl-undecaprenol N-acetylglucosamine transferase
VLVVFGGSIGALTLNELALEAWGAAGPAVLHVTGERDYERLRLRVERSDYRLVPFLEDFGAALGAADLIVARSGGSVWEIAAAGKPAVLVPYPEATGDHQRANALYFERAGGAVVVLDGDARANVPPLVEHLLTAPARLEKMGAAMRAAAKPDAAERIADELIALAAARR